LAAKIVARSGFKAVAYDAPAHSSIDSVIDSRSNMFEYGRALASVAEHFGPVYAVVGHSLGAMCAAFTAFGFLMFETYRVRTRKIVLISAPPTVSGVLENFCRNAEEPRPRCSGLKEALEGEFDFSVDSYRLEYAISGCDGVSTLFVHDAEDSEFSLDDTKIVAARVGARLFETVGSGHHRTVGNRSAIKEIVEFLSK
jgi:pimeloyl-ACP methyl ester carboxylesterase